VVEAVCVSTKVTLVAEERSMMFQIVSTSAEVFAEKFARMCQEVGEDTPKDKKGKEDGFV
jgi:hypothetical protein